MFTSNLYLSYRGMDWTVMRIRSSRQLVKLFLQPLPRPGHAQKQACIEPLGLTSSTGISATKRAGVARKKYIELVTSRTFPDLYYLISEWKLYYSLLGYQIFSSIWHQVAVTAFILTYPIFSPVNHHQERKRAHGDFEASCTSSLGGNFVRYMWFLDSCDKKYAWLLSWLWVPFSFHYCCVGMHANRFELDILWFMQ